MKSMLTICTLDFGGPKSWKNKLGFRPRNPYSEIWAGTLQAARPGCAGWARNPTGPKITPFCHQVGRRGTIWNFKIGIRHKIPAQISPWGSRGLNPNFLFAYFGPKNAKKQIFWQGSEIIGTHSNGFGGPGAHGGPRGLGTQRAQGLGP